MNYQPTNLDGLLGRAGETESMEDDEDGDDKDEDEDDEDGNDDDNNGDKINAHGGGENTGTVGTVTQLIAGARANNQHVVRETAMCDITYTQKYTIFKNFVRAHREGGVLPPGDSDFTGDTVDLFFSILVANMTGITPKSAKTYLYSIEYYAKLDGFGAIALRPVVIESFAAQQAGYLHLRNNNGGCSAHHPDPHSNRHTDILSEVENRAVVAAILSRTDWVQLYPC
jgi:hypothetical protein